MAKGHSIRMHNMAIELGYISIYWGWIESSVDWAIIKLVPLTEEDTANAIVGNIEIRAKLQITKALAFIRKPSREWFDCMTEILDYIDNDLRNKRNHFIHASWHAPGGKITRVRKKTRIYKPQAFQIALSTEEKIPIKIGEARKLRKELLRAMKTLMFAVLWALDRELQSIPARRYLRLAGFVDRRQGGDARFSPPSGSSRR